MTFRLGISLQPHSTRISKIIFTKTNPEANQAPVQPILNQLDKVEIINCILDVMGQLQLNFALISAFQFCLLFQCLSRLKQI